MDTPNRPADDKLHQAAEFIRRGQKKEARQLLRELLVADGNNLAAWELISHVANSFEEEIYCLKHILSLKPDHPWAKKRLTALNASLPPGQATQKSQAAGEGTPASNPLTGFRSSGVQPAPAKRKRSPYPILLGILAFLCLGLFGLILFRFRYLLSASPSSQTATALALHDSTCQELIDRALQASGDSCKQVGSNKVCYGNNTIQAKLIPNTEDHFSNRGDIVDVSHLQQLAVSPFDLEKNDWGIAIFKVMANLPRSLPGETVTMVVFGNTILDNKSPNLESFYFSSELGKITCEKAPFDGMMVTMPNGTGIHFTVNGTELTLAGNASLKAVKNQNMEVSLYSGSGKVVANGKEQYFGAGQQVTIPLGGPNGNDAVGGPSSPQPISPDKLTLACTMTGQYCNPTDITPVSETDAKRLVETGVLTPTHAPATITRTPSKTNTPTITATPTKTQTGTQTATPTRTGTGTRTVTATATATRTLTQTSTRSATWTWTRSATWTVSRTFTLTPSRTSTPTRSATPTSTRTSTASSTSTLTSSATNTASATSTFTATNTATPTDTNTPTHTPTDTATDTPTYTPTDTATPNFTLTVTNVVACPGAPNITISGTNATMSLTNSGSSPLTITSILMNWIPGGPGNSAGFQSAALSVAGVTLWSGDQLTSPFTLDSGNMTGTGSIAVGVTDTLTLSFKKTPDTTAGGSFTVQVTYNDGSTWNGCR